MNYESLLKSATSSALNNMQRKPEGIEIIQSVKSKIINAEQIKINKKFKSAPEDAGQWVAANFVSYAKKLYKERYNRDWELNFSAQCNYILLVKDDITDAVGYCDNHTLKEFIEWFFENKADYFLEKNRDFYFTQMRKLWVIQEFAEKILKRKKEDLIQFKPQEVKPKEIKPDIDHEFNLFDNNKMISTYLLSDEDFVLNYGIIVATCWLVSKQSFTLKDAVKYVYYACDKLAKQGKLNQIKNVTEQFNPYPENAIFLDADRLIKKISADFSIEVKTGHHSLSSISWLTK